MLGFGNGCVNWAEQYVPSGLAAVLIATAPFFLAGIDALFPDGKIPGVTAILGLIVGFIGILVLLWPALRFHDAAGLHFLGGVLALQVACLGWAIGFRLLEAASSSRPVGPRTIGGADDDRRAPDVRHRDPLGRVVARPHGRPGLGGDGVPDPRRLARRIRSYVYALKHLPVTLVSLYAYVNPLIAVVLGAIFLGEPFGIRTLIAMAIVFVGIGLVHVPSGSALLDLPVHVLRAGAWCGAGCFVLRAPH